MKKTKKKNVFGFLKFFFVEIIEKVNDKRKKKYFIEIIIGVSTNSILEFQACRN